MRSGSRVRVDQQGFTLAELLVVIAIVGLIMAGLLTLMKRGNESYLAGANQVEAQSAVRATLERMTQEVREAGYNPQGLPACAGGLVPPNCLDAIVNATATSFVIQNDWNGNGTIEPAVAVPITYCFGGPCPPTLMTNVNRGEQITYSLVGGPLLWTICRRETAVDPPATAPCLAGQPLLTTVQDPTVGPNWFGQNCAGGQVARPPFFQFCDANGNPAATQDAIRTVEVNLRVGVQNTAPVFWQAGAVQVTMNDRIRLRNRIP